MNTSFRVREFKGNICEHAPIIFSVGNLQLSVKLFFFNSQRRWRLP